MTSEELPKEFDVIVMGTGLPEAMVAASLARCGKKVLHIDRNSYYGGHWSTFPFDSLLEWLNVPSKQESKKNDEAELNIEIPSYDFTVHNKVIQSFMLEKNDEIEVKDPESSIIEPISGETDKSKDINNVEKSVDENKLPSDTNDSVSTDNFPPFANKDTVSKSCIQEPQKFESSLQVEDNENLKSKIKKKKIPPSSIVSQAKIKQQSNDVTLEDFKILSRKFNLDISAKFLFSAGPLVKAILKANISHYADFQTVDRILTCKDGKIIEVPCNRADVFTSSFLTMIEKRMLMKFLTFCAELNFDESSEELQSYQEKPLIDFLKSRRLSDNLQNFVIYSIAMVKPNTPTLEGLKETRSFLMSLGKYGKSPFIWPLFGVGELPQAFCRMSAVFASLYCLDKPVTSIYVDDSTNKCTHVVIDGKDVKCAYIIMDRSYVPVKYYSKNQETGQQKASISKAILITNASVLTSSSDHVSFLTIPPLPGKDELVRVIEVGPAASACPKGLFVLYLTSASVDTAVNDLEEYTKLLTRNSLCSSSEVEKPKLLWSCYFNQDKDNSDIENLPSNVFVTCMPGSSLGFANAVVDAENICKEIAPEEEFLLKVPNPEDIIWDTDQNTEGNGNADEDKSTIKNSSENSESSLCLSENVTSNVDKQDKSSTNDVLVETENIQDSIHEDDNIGNRIRSSEGEE